jgi:hypothetical protein
MVAIGLNAVIQSTITKENEFMKVIRAAVPALISLMCAHSALAEPTEIVIRVMAKDAKFVGTETGGAQITLSDADSGKVLAQGLTDGATGNTPKIMTDPRSRREVASDDKSAKFITVLDIQKPTRITVTATGPMIPKASAITVSSTQWVLPGKSVNGGDGWVLELPGFAIDLLEPLPKVTQLHGATVQIPIKAKVTMQCGCPITPGGLWDANKLEVAAMLERKGKVSPAMPLSFAGQPSTFNGEIAVTEPGDYTVDVYAYDHANGNTGVAKFALKAK